MARIEEQLLEPSRMLLLASDDRTEPPAAMVFTHRVAPEKVPAYLEWRRRASVAQAHCPSYLATEFFEPRGKVEEWVDIVRYGSIKDLTDWMESKERQDLLAELDSIVESRHSHRVTGLEGWFAINRGPDQSPNAPSSWKQTLAVLFALYPTVMALNYVSPLMGNLSLPINMLISNMLSVAMLHTIQEIARPNGSGGRIDSAVLERNCVGEGGHRVPVASSRLPSLLALAQGLGSHQ
jgi:uncharacterized protein